MNISNLKIGTKLMWDAPEPFEGYAMNLFMQGRSTNAQRITYPAIVVDRRPINGTKIKSGNKGNWMGDEEEYLRMPTITELNTLTWPEL
jgi:hypothetical protein